MLNNTIKAVDSDAFVARLAPFGPGEKTPKPTRNISVISTCFLLRVKNLPKKEPPNLNSDFIQALKVLFEINWDPQMIF
jgi:hypothetical protein